MLELLGGCDVKEAAPKIGDGKLDTPYSGLCLENWRFLASEKAREDPIFYSVGGRLLVRWGTKAGGMKDYISDMTDYPVLLKAILEGKEKTGAVKTKFDEDDDVRGIDTTLAAYSKKALRVDNLTDEAAANRCRSLLNNSSTSCDDCPEIASSFCSLFVAEAHRAPKTFVISLMLLDAVETRTTYGVEGKKTYTWKSMLMHSKDETSTLDVPGRSTGVKMLAKHPMAGVNTVKLSKDMLNWKTDNAVRDRVVSLMSLWLAHYLQKIDSTRKYYLLRTDKSAKEKIRRSNKPDDLKLVDLCKDALATRCSTYACQIGGTSIEYRNTTGDAV